MSEIIAPSAHAAVQAAEARRVSFPELAGLLRERVAEPGCRALAVLVIELRLANRLAAMRDAASRESILDTADRRLAEALRPADRFARLSSEQVFVLLPDLPNGALAELAAIKILSALQKPIEAGAEVFTVRPHIGIATFPEHARDANGLLNCADIASRIATTRVGYHIYRPEDHVEAGLYSGLDSELAQAIKANALRVTYQPQVEVATLACVGAEALVRWTTPDGGNVNPATLVGIAENTGLIGPLSVWVLNTVLRNATEFSRTGLDVRLGVNLSTNLFADIELPRRVEQALAMWGLPPERLTLEITESAIMRDVERAIVLLGELRDLGVQLSIDDFGTGYSSLAYLKRFPVHELKIDKLFVQHMHESRGDLQIVRAIIDLAHAFGLSTVAEGVEDEATLERLRELRCDVVQGFLFGRAMPQGDFMAWAAGRRSRAPDPVVP